MFPWNRDHPCGKTYEFDAPVDPEKSAVATLRSSNSQNRTLLGSFIDSKAHVRSNLQKPSAAHCTKPHKNAQCAFAANEPQASATGLAGPSAAPPKTSRRAKTLTDNSTDSSTSASVAGTQKGKCKKSRRRTEVRRGTLKRAPRRH
jgi:hypothetical protein